MEDLPFVIEELRLDTGYTIRVLARADNAILGKAAFDAACRYLPAARICYRCKARVISQRTGNALL